MNVSSTKRKSEPAGRPVEVTIGLPTMEAGTTTTTTAAAMPEAKPAPVAAPPDIPAILLEIPLGREPQVNGIGHDVLPNFVSGALLELPQQIALWRLLRGLDTKGVRMACGRRPDSYIDAIRWLLDQIAAA